MRRRVIVAVVLLVCVVLPCAVAWGQVTGSRWWAIRLAEDPGISWILVTETPQYRVLRDFAEPGATRRMHHHADVRWHVLTLATGRLMLTVEGDAAVPVVAGQSLALKGGVNHTFTNVGPETATIIEVFGKSKP